MHHRNIDDDASISSSADTAHHVTGAWQNEPELGQTQEEQAGCWSALSRAGQM